MTDFVTFVVVFFFLKMALLFTCQMEVKCVVYVSLGPTSENARSSCQKQPFCLAPLRFLPYYSCIGRTLCPSMHQGGWMIPFTSLQMNSDHSLIGPIDTLSILTLYYSNVKGKITGT